MAMLLTTKHLFVRLSIRLLLTAMSLGGIGAASLVWAQSMSVEQIESRIVIGFQVNAEQLQSRLPSPWQLRPLADGPLKGANFLIVLVDNLRTEDPKGKVTISGALRFAVFE